MRIAGLMRAMAVGSVVLVMLTVHRDTFDRSFLQGALFVQPSGPMGSADRVLCFRGSRALRDPSPRFSQIGYAEMFPFTFGYPPILHVLLFPLNQFVPNPPQATLCRNQNPKHFHYPTREVLV